MGKFDKVLLASDYDGTLYDENGEITPQVRQAIGYFMKNGGRFTVSTGRTQHGFHAFDSSYINAPVLLANGAMAYDYAAEKVIFERPLGEEIIPVIKAVREKFPDTSVEFFPHEGGYILHDSATSQEHFQVLKMPVKVIDTPEQADPPWAKVMFFSEEQSLLIQQFLTERFPWVKYLPTTGRYVEMLQQGVDKGSGLFDLADALGIDHKDCYAVGDGENDVQMLQAAAIGFAPENGSDMAKQIADRIVRPNTDGTVAHVIEILDEIY